jgi:uncharacterized protein
MKRDEAYKLMCEMVQSPNLRRHGVAVEAIMKSLCIFLKEREEENLKSGTSPEILHPKGTSFSEAALSVQDDIKSEFNEEEWGVVGMLHDADYEIIGKDLEKHTLVTAEKLRSLGVSERIIEGIRAHHWGVKPTRDNIMEKAVFCADDTSGLITACALIMPDKKLASVKLESVIKKFKNPSFAAGAKREQIQACDEELGIPLEEFLGIALRAMQGISNELGL